VAGFYSARSETIPPLPGPNFAPPFPDPELDQAVAFRKLFMDFSTNRNPGQIKDSFSALRLALLRSGAVKD
jgi:hypothetical protein